MKYSSMYTGGLFLIAGVPQVSKSFTLGLHFAHVASEQSTIDPLIGYKVAPCGHIPVLHLIHNVYRNMCLIKDLTEAMLYIHVTLQAPTVQECLCKY